MNISRYIFLLHRYLGIGLGVIVTLWCLSGFVMMYVPFPEVSRQEKLFASPHLTFDDCCQVPSVDEFAEIPLSSARISLWPFRPILFLTGQGGEQYAIDLHSGEYLYEITSDMARAAARQYANQSGSGTVTQSEGMVESDQWTVTGYFNQLRPFHKYRIFDGDGTRLYVSAVTGEVVQETRRAERFLNWGGAVIHWLYPSIIRQHQTLWYWTVVSLSIIGLFLTLTGLYIAIRYLQLKKGKPLSPYSGLGMWHHYIGLAFGILTLTWVGSGLLSMQPWGLLEGRSTAFERAAVQRDGQMLFDQQFRDQLRGLQGADLGGDVVWIEFSKADGAIGAILYNKSGDAVRYDPTTWLPDSLNDFYFEQVAERIKPENEIREAVWIEQQDNYYYSLKSNVRLPVYRVTYDDGEIAYFDNVTGELVYLVDSQRKWYRWLFNGFHSLDFTAGLRQRPVWDFVVWLLLGGVTAGAITGTWLGYQRLTGTRDYSDTR